MMTKHCKIRMFYRFIQPKKIIIIVASRSSEIIIIQEVMEEGSAVCPRSLSKAADIKSYEHSWSLDCSLKINKTNVGIFFKDYHQIMFWWLIHVQNYSQHCNKIRHLRAKVLYIWSSQQNIFSKSLWLVSYRHLGSVWQVDFHAPSAQVVWCFVKPFCTEKVLPHGQAKVGSPLCSLFMWFAIR